MDLDPTLKGIAAQSPCRHAWLQNQLADMESPLELYRAFALVPRAPREKGLDAANTLDEQCRLALLLNVQQRWAPEQFQEVLETLFCTADVTEAVQLYRFLPKFDQPGLFLVRAREGARSNTVPLFEAVAHHNTYPRDYFDDGAWNQLVLKAVFLDVALAPIEGLDERNTLNLAIMLGDYVQERWVAGRTVPWEVWRLLGPFFHKPRFARVLGQAMVSEDPATRQAASLAAHLADPAWARAQPGFLATVTTMSWQQLRQRLTKDLSHVY